ncbi:MAG: DUF3667 domain-containing protein [Sphingomonas sp.]|nr:DUF3667 domain-containing protein [Sphingomonas sp.]
MATSWTCPSCGKRRRTKFCAECGEERLRPRDLSFTDLAARFARTLSSVDGKLLRSSRAIFVAPGALTDSYIRGERRRFLGPLQLFLIANALFFAVQSLTNTNVLSSSLDSHLHVQDWRDFAQSLVADRFGDDEQAIAAFAKSFDRAAIFNAKALIILMVLAFAPAAALLFRGAHRAAGAHIVFALHLYSFVLLVLCVALSVAEASLLLGGGGLASPVVDTWLSLANVAVCGAYIYLAIGPAYSARGLSRTVAAIVLTATLALLFVGYRFAIFVITFYTS